jgi:hypothetical protein
VCENNQPKQTMTKNKNKLSKEEIKSLMEKDPDFLKPMLQFVVQEVLEAEMSETVGAEKGERAEGRQGYRSGYYRRSFFRPRPTPTFAYGIVTIRSPRPRTRNDDNKRRNLVICLPWRKGFLGAKMGVKLHTAAVETCSLSE